MKTVALFLVAVIYTQSVCGSYSDHQAYGYESGYGHGGDYGYDHGSYSGHDDLRYHGPTAIPHVLKDGHIADTHDVAVAKAAHYTAVAKAKAHSGYGYDSSNYGGDYGYGGSYGHGYGSHGVYGNDYSNKYAGVYHTTPYHGPIAKPVVLKSGYLADTHEVAAAKEAHHNAVVSAKAHSGYGSDGYKYEGDYGYGGSYGYGKNYGYGSSYEGYGHDSSSKYANAYHSAPYHGPLAKPVVLKSGYLADTHEVAAAKAHHLSALHSTASHYSYDNKW